VDKRKNIIIFLSDQQNRHALNCAGNFDVDTPHIDSVAKNGTICDRAYSNNPVCGPYRGTLLTGCYSSHSGMLRNGDALPTNRPLFASLFNDAGYQTAWVGKWHLGGSGNDPIPRYLQGDFTHFNGYQCYNHFTEGIVFHDHNERRQEFNGYRTTVTTDLALQELASLNQAGKPFMLFVSYQAPHYPLQPSEEFLQHYYLGGSKCNWFGIKERPNQFLVVFDEFKIG
jgi:arylsulfatase A-like enzyme